MANSEGETISLRKETSRSPPRAQKKKKKYSFRNLVSPCDTTEQKRLLRTLVQSALMTPKNAGGCCRTGENNFQFAKRRRYGRITLYHHHQTSTTDRHGQFYEKVFFLYIHIIFSVILLLFIISTLDDGVVEERRRKRRYESHPPLLKKGVQVVLKSEM